MKAMQWLSPLLAGVFVLAASSLASAQDEPKVKDNGSKARQKAEQEILTYSLARGGEERPGHRQRPRQR